jgi:hypothetical protein
MAICHESKPLQETLKHLKNFVAQMSSLNVEILQQLQELSSTLSQTLTLKLSTT